MKLILFVFTLITTSTLAISHAASTSSNAWSVSKPGLREIQEAQVQTRLLLETTLNREQLDRLTIVDRKLTKAVELLVQITPQPRPRSTIELYNSDSCSSDLIAIVGPTSRCDLFKNERRTWGVKLDGRCYNISDMNSDLACEAFKGSQGRSVKIYNSDSCSGDLLAIVNAHTNCKSLVSLQRAWGVEINGQCQNITDRETVDACEAFKNY